MGERQTSAGRRRVDVSDDRASHAPADVRREHFVTLFDDSFLPIGLALYQSLVAQGQAVSLVGRGD